MYIYIYYILYINTDFSPINRILSAIFYFYQYYMIKIYTKISYIYSKIK